MPVYEYECERCFSRFELKRNFGEDGGAPCPHCQGSAHRLFSPVPIIFKGTGFYVTDSRKTCECSPDESRSENLGIS